MSKSIKELEEIDKPATLVSLVFVNKSKNSLQGLEKFKNLIELDLTSNHLSNPVPELLHLKFLKKLSLSHNSISQIWELPQTIEQLNLSNNFITALDSVLPTLKRLQSLNLSQNCITSPSPLSALAHLRALNLSHNKITSISGLEALQELLDLNLDSNFIQVLPLSFPSSSLCLLVLKNNPCLKEKLKLENFGFIQQEEGVFLRLTENKAKFKLTARKSKREEYAVAKMTPSFRSRNSSMQEIYDQVISEDPEMEDSFSGSESEDRFRIEENFEQKPVLGIAKLQLEKIFDKPGDKLSEKWSTKADNIEALLEDFVQYCGLCDMVNKDQSSGDKYESLFRVLKQREEDRKNILKDYEKAIQLNKLLELKIADFEDSKNELGKTLENSEKKYKELDREYKKLKGIQKDLIDSINEEKSNYLKNEEKLHQRIKSLEDERNSSRLNLSCSYESDGTLLSEYQDFDVKKIVFNNQAIVPIEVAEYIQKLLNKISDLVTKNKKIRLQREKFRFLLNSSNK